MRATNGGNSKINFIPVRDDRGQNLQWFSVFGTSLPIRLLKLIIILENHRERNTNSTFLIFNELLINDYNVIIVIITNKCAG